MCVAAHQQSLTGGVFPAEGSLVNFVYSRFFVKVLYRVIGQHSKKSQDLVPLIY